MTRERTWPTLAGFENGRIMVLKSKECGQPLEAGKGKEIDSV